MVGVEVEVTEMNLKLIHHTGVPPLDFWANEGFDLAEVKTILQQLEEMGVSSKIINVSGMSEKELSDLYIEAIGPAVYKKYHVRQVFGSKRHSGYLFGKGVPALLVYEPGKHYPSDVYPHRMGNRIVTIRAFLEGLLKKLERAPMTGERRGANKALVERMDRLREKIGPIGVPVALLIREGRRR